MTVVGAGAGGLAAAIDLATRGAAVTLLERAAIPGGKLRQMRAGGVAIDAGPTVLTMRWVFDRLFADAGSSVEAHLTLHSADLLARHAWSATERLDLFADIERSAEAIAGLAGQKEADGYRAFVARTQRVYRTLEGPFIRSPRPTAFSLTAGQGLRGLTELWGVSPFATLWKALGEHFRDPRLRQLFGRYATYSGSSPFQAPATLMLIAHVEQQGVWLVAGGMVRLAEALTALAERQGVVVRAGAAVAEIVVRDGRAGGVVLTTGERVEADAVVCNADYAALAAGAFGSAVAGLKPVPKSAARSLSAVTWALSAATEGFPLTRHNVFFCRDYKAEFDDIFRRGQLPAHPTVYVCAQDRGGPGAPPDGGPERLLVLVNAPPIGDRHIFTSSEIEPCARQTFGLLERCGLTIHYRPEATAIATPTDFAALFPATGGALYGQAVHGSMAAFRRPGARSTMPGLYLAGGSVHPGPGVPMAVLSGRLAAASLLRDLTSG
ncbi:1-hydroxycarotenoid 3,4-desaturase CrtD [Rhodopila sp.]|uniref:1-hydroxycarotenoid 3,4-desaturase CrtD n=1 Tax=Rhodopila sp. TaxID=2480087 RepID=UPI003D0ED525